MSVTSINYAGNGNFQMTVNGQQRTLNLADLNTMLRMEQISSYDQAIADQLSAIQQTNQRRKALNQLLQLMRSQKAQSKNGTGSDASAAAKPVASVPGSELPSPTAERPSDKDAQYGQDVQGYLNVHGDSALTRAEAVRQADKKLAVRQKQFDALQKHPGTRPSKDDAEYKKVVKKRGRVETTEQESFLGIKGKKTTSYSHNESIGRKHADIDLAHRQRKYDSHLAYHTARQKHKVANARKKPSTGIHNANTKYVLKEPKRGDAQYQALFQSHRKIVAATQTHKSPADVDQMSRHVPEMDLQARKNVYQSAIAKGNTPQSVNRPKSGDAEYKNDYVRALSPFQEAIAPASEKARARKVADAMLASRQAEFDQKYAPVVPKPAVQKSAVPHPGPKPVFKRSLNDTEWKEDYRRRYDELKKQKPELTHDKLHGAAETTANMYFWNDSNYHKGELRRYNEKLKEYEASNPTPSADAAPQASASAVPLAPTPKDVGTPEPAHPDPSPAAGTYTLDGVPGSKTIAGWMEHFGIPQADVKNGSAGWDANINATKSAIDNITSDSEMQMLRFRQMVDKRGTALQEAKTTLSNDKRLKDAIVQG